jgi:hypothetical protein
VRKQRTLDLSVLPSDSSTIHSQDSKGYWQILNGALLWCGRLDCALRVSFPISCRRDARTTKVIVSGRFVAPDAICFRTFGKWKSKSDWRAAISP